MNFEFERKLVLISNRLVTLSVFQNRAFANPLLLFSLVISIYGKDANVKYQQRHENVPILGRLMKKLQFRKRSRIVSYCLLTKVEETILHGSNKSDKYVLRPFG